MNNYSAILLLGPTGSGKTPLGDYLEQNGFRGKRCYHFDFGEQLRSIAQSRILPLKCTQEDIVYIIKVLREGALLGNETFYIAENILQSFITENRITKKDFIILNGLPRHIGQAGDIDRIVSVKRVVYLACTPEVVCNRIEINSGGDRNGRIDDSVLEIEKKLNLFQHRTRPLLDYYQNKKVLTKKITVEIDTTPGKILQNLNNPDTLFLFFQTIYDTI